MINSKYMYSIFGFSDFSNCKWKSRYLHHLTKKNFSLKTQVLRKSIIMDDSNQMEQAGGPVQCRNGCGFYSNAGTDGLCSVCYKDCIKKKQQPPTNMPASLAPSSMAPSSSANPSQMASLSIGETAMATTITSSVPSSSPTLNINKSGPISVETASPTVILPSSSTLQTEKVN